MSVGIPVYNGARHLSDTIRSLQDQTCADFELLISDNASTDGTLDVCRDAAARDSRIRLLCQDHNLGLAANWNLLVREARSQYFKWAPCNDTVSRGMLADCVALLDQRPDVVLAYPRTMIVTGMEHRVEEPFVTAFTGDKDTAFARFQDVLANMTLNCAICGVARRDALLAGGLIRGYPASDMVLMSALALMGRMVEVPSALLYRRMDPHATTRNLSRAELISLHDPQATVSQRYTVAKYADLLWLALSVRGVPLGDRLRSMRLLLRHASWVRRDLLRELLGSPGPR